MIIIYDNMKKNTTFFLRRSLMTLAASAMMLLSSQSVSAYTYTALSGTGGTGAEGYASLVDGNIKTNMGHSYTTGSSECWIIFKASNPLVPRNYFLVTGGNSGIYTGRNWSSWNIYAANFSSDTEAKRESNSWILVDEKKNELLPDENNATLDFVCSNIPTTSYRYFMIEVTECATMTDIWMQMAEFGFGSSAEFINSSLFYTVIDGDRNDGSNEGLSNLFDDNYYTKWGNGITENEPQFAIFKASHPIVPTYYCLVTGNDNATWTGRNWKTWRIYGLAATSDGEATRNAAGWTLIDERIDVTEDILPNYNSYEVFFTLNQGNTTAYQYFKIEISSIMSGSGYMQMGEFYFGVTPILQCAKPNVNYENGKIKCTCETESVTYVYTITPINSSGTSTNGEISLGMTFNVSVYAQRENYFNSEVATTTISLADVGDINGDGKLSVEDVAKLVDIIMKKE